MNNRGPVRSFTESHRAEVSRPDRGNCYSKPSGFRPQRQFPRAGCDVGACRHHPCLRANHGEPAALKLKGWTDAETQTFTTVRGTFPASTTTQQSGQSDTKKATGVKAADAADAYEHILTIQNAADLEFPATNPANAPQRAEFRLGILPPNHHAAPANTGEII